MSGRWAVEFIDVHKRVNRERILRGLDLGIPSGTVSVILGPAGSGKSLIVRLVSGMLLPDDGDVLVHERSVTRMRRRQLAKLRRELGVAFQTDGLFGRMSVFDNLAFALQSQGEWSEREIRRRVHARLDEAGLRDVAALRPDQLPLAERRLTACLRGLIADPSIAIFDDPAAGLDPVRSSIIFGLLERAHAARGGTYMVLTREIEVARRLGGHVALLWRGRALDEGRLHELLDSPHPLVRRYLEGTPEAALSLGLDLRLDHV